ncbi:MAG: TVP38/TMEM64 family protein [Clostridia bacterium]|nr:TVP38/TMEM64 family protein [Clostridia bacterium]
MNKHTQITINLLNALCGAISIVGVALFFPAVDLLWRVVLYVAVSLVTLATLVLTLLGKHTLAKTAFVINLTVVIIVVLLCTLNLTGVLQSFEQLDILRQQIENSGYWGYAICVLAIVLQVVVLPVPATAMYFLVTAIYGSWIAFVLCFVGTLIGSLIAFSIGKLFGKKAVTWIVGKEQTTKWSTLLAEKGRVPFIVMQILPFFPDDVLCMVAGLSSMSYRFFIITMTLIKPIYIAFVCFLGTGELIPFSGWGIPVWIAIFALFGVMVYFYFKYQRKIDNFFASKKTTKDNQ